MNVVVITGLSGAGKSYAVKFFEDMGYYCVDNMPPKLMLPFINMPGRSEDADEKIAFVIDIRGGEQFNTLIPALSELEDNGISYKVLFLKANADVLVARYKEAEGCTRLLNKVIF